MSRYDLAELGTLTDAAEALRPGVSPHWLYMHATRYVDFPAPVATFGGTDVFELAEVVAWEAARGDGRAGITPKMARRMGQ